MSEAKEPKQMTSYVELSQDNSAWARRARRILINGPPNSRKTSSLATWPGPLFVQSYPGEKGTASIPKTTVDGLPVKAFAFESPEAEVNWSQVVKDTKALTIEILSGKLGEVKTFAGDGLHKLYFMFLAEATFGASARGENFDAKLYGNAGTRFFQYVDLVMRSNVENVVFTCWDGHEKDDPDEKGTSPSRHIFPELPGQASKKIMGEFSISLYATKDPAGKFVWQTQPSGKVWGAGVKLPVEVAKTLPLFIEQDWRVLEKALKLS